MRRSKLLKLNFAGDTIIEVLLAILVVSAVLGGAYVSASQSLSGTRQAEERAEALKLAEGQIESLKVSASKTTTYANLFCMNTGDVNNAQPVNATTTTPTPPVNAQPYTVDNDPLNEYTIPTCQTGTVPYNLSITRNPDGSGYLFAVYVRWARVGGGGNEEVKLLYRLNP